MRKLHKSLHCYRAMAFVALAALLLVTVSSAPVAADKMRAEDVIANHLKALGADAKKEQSRVAIGSAHAIFKARSTSGVIDGRMVLASTNRKLLFAFGFNSPNYPGEKFGFDGKKYTVNYLTPGVRSALGNFMYTNSSIFKEGLLGGTLTSAWPLLNLEERGAKVEYAGMDKIDGKPVHKLRYSPSKGSDLNITLFFDATTFQHVRTQYDMVQSSRLASGGYDNQARQMETRYKMIEDFSDYKKEGDLTLPHTYKLQLEITKTGGSSLDKWEVTLEQFAFNQPLEDEAFNVEGK